MSSLRYLNTVLTVLAVLAALGLWTAWSASPAMLPAAQAQGIPDTGAQNQQIIDQLKLLNRKTDDIAGILASGKLRVTAVVEDKKN